jgi:ribonuclease BN (tRNA processing enzyme)
MARLIFLGTSAALATAERTNALLAVIPETQPSGLLIDCGGDVCAALQRARLGPDAISDLLITHAHIDHIGSLPSLIESLRLGGRTTPLRIYALPEVIEVARRIVQVFDYELTLDSWTFDVSFTAVSPGQELALGGMPARVLGMDHTLPSVGVRLELPRGPVAYTSDTQPTAAVQELARGAHTLISECTFLRGAEAAARVSKHTTAFEAGQEATACGVERLALVHIGGWSIAEARAEVAAAFSGEILFPNDGDEIAV